MILDIPGAGLNEVSDTRTANAHSTLMNCLVGRDVQSESEMTDGWIICEMSAT
jgi:hypothetical protein